MPKISQLPTLTNITTGSIIPVVESSTTQKISVGKLFEFLSGALDQTFATEVELLRSASGITSSFEAFTSSVDARLDVLETPELSLSASQISSLGFVTTGSNTFTQSQTISAGNSLLVNRIENTTGGNIEIAASGLLSLSGDGGGVTTNDNFEAKPGGNATFKVTSGSVSITGSIYVSGTPLISSSTQITALGFISSSAAINTSSFATTGSNTFIGNQGISGSIFIGDDSGFGNHEIVNENSGLSIYNRGGGSLSLSASNGQIYLNPSQYGEVSVGGNMSISGSGGINFSTSSHIKFVNDGFPYSANNDIEIKAGNIRISSSFDNPNTGLHISGNTFVSGFIQMGDVFGDNPNWYFLNFGESRLYGGIISPTLNSYLETSSFNTFSSSVHQRLLSATNEQVIDGFVITSSFNSYTSSNNSTNTTQNSRLSSLENNSGSYLLKSETGSFITEAETGSFLTSIPNGIISSSAQITNFGFATTSSVLNVDTSSLVTTSSFNSFTSSYTTSSFTGSFTGSFRGNITGLASQASLVLTQNSNVNGDYSLLFVTSGSNGYMQTYSDGVPGILYNPSTNRLKSPFISGAIEATNGVISGSSQITNFGFATTSSVLNVDTSSLVTTSSFDTFSSSVNTTTASLIGISNGLMTYTASLKSAALVSGSLIESSSYSVVSDNARTMLLYSNTQDFESYLLFSNAVAVNSATIAGNNNIRYNSSTNTLTVGTVSATKYLGGVVSSSTQITNFGFATTSSLAVVTPFLSSSEFNTFATSSNSFTASVIATGSLINTFTSSINAFTASERATGSILNTFTSSVNTFTASVIATGSLINTFTSSVNTATASLNRFTASAATTASNVFVGNQTITGSLTVVSLTTISSSVSANSSSLYLNSGSNLYVQNAGLVEITGSLIVSASTNLSGSVTINNSRIDNGWTAYTPQWTAASSNPVINNGTIEGYYKVIGKTCFVRGNIAMGSTTTFGTGEWYVSMPFTASHADAILMSVTLLDNGSAWYNATMVGARAGFNHKAPIQYQNTGGTASDVNPTGPFTWTTSDRFIWNGSYEIA